MAKTDLKYLGKSLKVVFHPRKSGLSNWAQETASCLDGDDRLKLISLVHWHMVCPFQVM